MIFSDKHQIGFLVVLLGQEQRCAFYVSTQCLKLTTGLSQCLFWRLGSISNVGRRNHVCISMRGRPYLELGGFVLLVTAQHSDDICGRSVILHRLRLLLFARSCFYTLSCHWYQSISWRTLTHCDFKWHAATHRWRPPASPGLFCHRLCLMGLPSGLHSRGNNTWPTPFLGSLLP